MIIFNNTSCVEDKNAKVQNFNQSEITASKTEKNSDIITEGSIVIPSHPDELKNTDNSSETDSAKTETEIINTENDTSSIQSANHDITKDIIETPQESIEKTPEENIVLPLVTASPEEVELLIAKHINNLRLTQGDTTATVLTGLTKVARYRANEIITGFNHTDIREVCGKLEYGAYYDMTQYGMDASYNYYEGYDREAIAKGNWGGTADEIAQSIANGFKSSTKHWEYVGDSKYGYMAVGATYNEPTNMWYVCICMSSINYGG